MKKILSDNKKTYLFFLILSLLFYGNSIKNNFCFDDSYVTPTNVPVKGQKYRPDNKLVAAGIAGIPQIWRSRYGHGEGTAYDYRPVVSTLFAIEYSLFGQSPHLNHFVSIVLYSLIAFYLFQILRICLREYPYKDLFSLVCAVLFVAHPLHTEAVDNIKCTDELLALLFGLLATFQVIRYYETKKLISVFFCGLFILLGYYSKLTAALFIVLIPLTLFFFMKLDKKQILFSFLGLVIFYLLHNLIRSSIVTEKEVRYFFHFENPLYTEKLSLIGKILFSLKCLGIYLKLLFFPYPLRFYYGSALVPTQLTIFDFEILLALGFSVFAFWFCYKTKNKIALFGLLFFFISIAPILNFNSPIAGIIAERLCMVASIGFIIFIVAIVFSLGKSVSSAVTWDLFSKKPWSYISILLLVFLIYTWNRNSVWDKEMTLFEHDAPFLEKSAGANNLLANKYFDMLYRTDSKYSQKELIDKCLYHYGLAINNDSSVYSAFNNAGVVIFSYLGNTREALNYFIRAVNANPDYPQANENIGNCYVRLGQPFEALKYYRRSIAQNYLQRKAYVQTIKILLQQKRYSEASKLFAITDKIIPNDYFLIIEKGNYYVLTDQLELAANSYERAYQYRRTREIAEALIKTYTGLHNDEKAAFFTKEASELAN